MLRDDRADPPTAVTSGTKFSGGIVEVDVVDDSDDSAPDGVLGQVGESAEDPCRHSLARGRRARRPGDRRT